MREQRRQGRGEEGRRQRRKHNSTWGDAREFTTSRGDKDFHINVCIRELLASDSLRIKRILTHRERGERN